LGYQIDYVTMAFRGMPRRETLDGITIHRIPCLRARLTTCQPWEMIPYILLAIPYCLWLVRRGDYAINHTHFIFPDGVISWAVRRLTGLPYLVTAHGSDVPGYNPDRFMRLHGWLAPLWRRVTRAARGLLCPSRVIESLVHARDRSLRTWIIPNAIDPRMFSVRSEHRKSVVVVTRMFERKGVQFLLEALHGIEPDWDVDILGDGPFSGELKRIAAGYGSRARFHGYVDNMSAEFKERFETAGIFVFTSEAENFPMVLLEAMAAGLPIITTLGTGCEEVVGEAALLVAPRNAGQLREALVRLMGDPALCTRLGAAGRARVETHFTWPTIAARTAEILEAEASVRSRAVS
jgi:glycosyltransferase involved in cell wall biosynthesis